MLMIMFENAKVGHVETLPECSPRLYRGEIQNGHRQCLQATRHGIRPSAIFCQLIWGLVVSRCLAYLFRYSVGHRICINIMKENFDRDDIEVFMQTITRHDQRTYPQIHKYLNNGYKVHTNFLMVPSFQKMYRLFAEIRNGTCLKSVSKTPTFRVFRDFQPLKGLLHTSSQMANFGQFLAKMGKTGFFQKSFWNMFFAVKSPN